MVCPVSCLYDNLGISSSENFEKLRLCFGGSFIDGSFPIFASGLPADGESGIASRFLSWHD